VEELEMVQLTVEIDEATAQAVRKMAEQSNKSDAEVVCDAVQSYVKSQRRKLPIGAGQFHSGDGTIASRTREIIRKAVEDGEWP
jgi:hypothetical protein